MMLGRKSLLLSLLLMFLVQGSTIAAERYYVDNKIKGYEKGEFVILDADDISFRERAFDGRVLKVLPHHSLLRVLELDGEWLKAQSDNLTGYIYAPFTSKGAKDELTQEDFAQGYAALGQKFDAEQAQAKLGALQSSSVDKKLKLTQYNYAGAVISVGRGKTGVKAIKVLDSKYITMRGVSVGDSAGRAVGQYGLPDGVIYEPEKTIYEYFMPDDKKMQLRFALEINSADKVEAFILERVDKVK